MSKNILTKESTIGWFKEWPKKTGFYWFYGYLYGNKNFGPELRTVQCVKMKGLKNQELRYLSNGSLLDPRDNHIGVFMKIETPKTPKSESLEAVEQK